MKNKNQITIISPILHHQAGIINYCEINEWNTQKHDQIEYVLANQIWPKIK